MKVTLVERVSRRARSNVWAAFLLLGLVGCSGAGLYLNATEGPYTVEVLPAQPPTWTYTVQSSGFNGIASVEIISSADLSLCKFPHEELGLSLSSKRTDRGAKIVLNTHGQGRVTASLTCPHLKKGQVYVRITDMGGIVRTLGPLAGPV